MSDVSKKVRKRQLSPFHAGANSSQAALRAALKELDDFALGRALLDHVRSLNLVSKGDRKPEFWRDPEHVKALVALAIAAYEGRRYSRSQYVFLACGAVEMAHESNWMAGAFEIELELLVPRWLRLGASTA